MNRLCLLLLVALLPLLFSSCRSVKDGKEASLRARTETTLQVVNKDGDDEDADDDDDVDDDEEDDEEDEDVVMEVPSIQKEKEKEEAVRVQRAKEMFRDGAVIDAIVYEFNNQKPMPRGRQWPASRPTVDYRKLKQLIREDDFNEHEFRELLKREIDINEPDSYGNVPLNYAIMARNMKMVRRLWEFGADVNGSGAVSPVSCAVESGNMEILRFLLEKGAGLQAAAKKDNLIASACEHPEMLKFLLAKGVPPDSRGYQDTTALMFVKGGSEALDILLAAGADPNAVSLNGRTPMRSAIATDDYAKVLRLLEHGVQCDDPHLLYMAVEHADLDMVRRLLDSGMNVNGYDTRSGLTPLCYLFPSPKEVSSEKAEAMARFLMERGADVTLGSCDIPELYAHRSRHNSSLYPIARYGSKTLLKDAIATVSPKSSIKLYAGDILTGAAEASNTANLLFAFELLGEDATKGDTLRNALFCAIEKGHLEAVKLLIEKGADVNFSNVSTDLSALDAAVATNNADTLSLLFDKGAEFSLPCDISSYPLTRHEQSIDHEMARTLVEHGANANIPPKGHETPLTKAVSSGNYRVVEYLVEHGANVNVKPRTGGNLLHVAAEAGNPQTISLLHTRGLDINARDRWGYRPALLAAFRGNLPAFLKLLAYHDASERPELLDKALARALRDCDISIAEHILANYDTLANLDGKARRNGIEEMDDSQKRLEQEQKDREAKKTPLRRFLDKCSHGECNLAELKRIPKQDLRPNETVTYGGWQNKEATALEYLLEGSDRIDYALLHDSIAYLLENGADPSVGTPVAKAVEKGLLDIALLMLRYCNSLNDKELYHRIMLEAAVAGRMDLARMIETLCPKDNEAMKSAERLLRKLAFYGDTARMQRLLDYMHVDVNCKNDDGDSPLFHALENGKVSAAMFLIEHGADINATGNGNETPLHCAARFDLGLVKYLVEHGLDVNASNKRGAPPLHHAIVFGRLDIADYLVSHGADISKSAPDGVPLFVCAALSCSERVLDYLVKKGIDINAKDENGLDAMQVATALNPNANAIEYLARIGFKTPSDAEITKTLRCYAGIGILNRPGVFHHQDVIMRMCAEMMEYN